MTIDRSSDVAQASAHFSARAIPVPSSISAAAQAALSCAQPTMTMAPSVNDKPAWREYIQHINETWAPVLRDHVTPLGARSETRTIAGVTVYEIEPPSIPPGNAHKLLLFFHGGGLVTMAGECTRSFGIMESIATRCRVFAVDYRNPPDHPYPAALDDCLAVYRELISRHPPSNVAFSGTSGGGNLAAAVLIKARDLGLPLPAAVGLFTPEIDLTEAGDSFQTNREFEGAAPDIITSMIALYAEGADLHHPYLSPLFADFSLGFPPAFIKTGTRDLFLSNSVLIHRALRRAGIEAELHVAEAMPHAGFGGAPEDIELREEFIRFLAKTAGWAPL